MAGEIAGYKNTKNTQERRARILELLRYGCTRRAASEASGISYETFRVWRREDAEFSEAVTEAEAFCECMMTVIVTHTARKGNPTFAMEWLRRRRRGEWGDKITVEETDVAPAPTLNLASLSDQDLADLERILEKAGT